MVLDHSIQKFIKVIIWSDGLMGHKILIIYAGTSRYTIVKDQDLIGASIAISLDNLLFNPKKTTDNATTITNDLADIMENICSG